MFTDFPLGNPVGKPYDVAMQRTVVELSLDMFENARTPRTTVRSPFTWGSNEWRARYLEVRDADRERLALMGEARRAERAGLRATGQIRAD